MRFLTKTVILAVVGPTASGKTKLAVELAKKFNGEVVSADSMQIYRYLSVSTARPTEEEMQGVPHHLIGHVGPDEEYSVARFLDEARTAINDIVSRGKLPILAGGTGLYVSSLLDGIRFADEERDPSLRERLQNEAKELGNEAMLQKLAEIDPEYAKTLHPNNSGRVLRALELYISSGVTMTEQRERSKLVPSEFVPIMVGIDYDDRQKLYDRINRRVGLMCENGLVDEAKGFFEFYKDTKTAAQAIGCKELLPYLEGEVPLDDCLEKLRMETRRYAKRQRTWFRRDERVKWFYPDLEEDENSLFEKVFEYVSQRLDEI